MNTQTEFQRNSLVFQWLIAPEVKKSLKLSQTKLPKVELSHLTKSRRLLFINVLGTLKSRLEKTLSRATLRQRTNRKRPMGLPMYFVRALAVFFFTQFATKYCRIIVQWKNVKAGSQYYCLGKKTLLLKMMGMVSEKMHFYRICRILPKNNNFLSRTVVCAFTRFFTSGVKGQGSVIGERWESESRVRVKNQRW